MSADEFNGRHSGNRPASGWLLVAVVLSVAIHLGLLLLLAGFDMAEKPRRPGIEISLSAPVAASEPATVTEEALGQSEPVLTQLETDSQLPVVEETQSIDQQASEPDPSATRPSTIAEQDSGTVERLDSLAILQAIRQTESPAQKPRTGPSPMPRLPDAPGWLNDHVGSVMPSSDSWREGDGSQRARIVSRSGDIWCGHNDPPPIADEFNPQFSVNVMRWRRCGRERPTPVDRADPWLRVPGG